MVRIVIITVTYTIFSRELSDLNLTFPFPAVDWTPEFGYPEKSPLDGFPWRPIGIFLYFYNKKL